MPRLFHRTSAEEIAEIAAAKALEKAFRSDLGQASAGTLTMQQARAQSEGYGTTKPLATPLPRDPRDAMTPFGPSTPLTPTPIDAPGPWGRPEPRRTEYDPTWNLQIGAERRTTPWTLLREMADTCDPIRRCIDIRKHSIQEKDWDIALTTVATQQMMRDDVNLRSQQRAQLVGREKFGPQIARIREALEEPDRENHMSWTEWTGNAFEEHFVWDALAVYPVLTYGRQWHSFRIIDGSTIKPLRDVYGNTPSAPFPAFQQILYGFPRGEFQASENPEKVFLHDQLFYRPRDRRSWTPYGSSPVEKALQLGYLWLRRMEWLREEFHAGSLPRAALEADKTWTDPAERVREEALLNESLSGDTRRRVQWTLFPAGFKPIFPPQLEQIYKPDLDQFIVAQIGSRFAVMPTQLGIIPNEGLFGRSIQPGEQDIDETEGDGPLEEWFVDLVNALARAYLGMPRELTLIFTGGGVEEDDAARATTDATRMNSAAKTVNQVRSDNGDDPYELPEANEPFVMGATGPVFLRGLLEQQDQKAQQAQAMAGKPSPSTPGAKDNSGPQRSAPGAKGDAEKTAAAEDEISAFMTFARRRAGGRRGWHDFEFAAVPGSLAKALNTAGQLGDLEACKVLAATVPKAMAAA